MARSSRINPQNSLGEILGSIPVEILGKTMIKTPGTTLRSPGRNTGSNLWGETSGEI